MENESGGYEVRVASSKLHFKSALIKRDITLIQKDLVPSGGTSLYEGFLDFLSSLVINKRQTHSEDAIILHSLTSIKRAQDMIDANGYDLVNTYFDNDKAGEEASIELRSSLGEKVRDHSASFAGYRDLNDLLLSQASRER